MIGTIVFCTLTQKGPCGMTVNNEIDDDSAAKHGDSHNYFRVTGAHDTVLGYADLFSVTLHDNDIQEFNTRCGSQK